VHIIMELCSGGDLVSRHSSNSSNGGSSGSPSCCGVQPHKLRPIATVLSNAVVSWLGSTVAYLLGGSYTTLRSTTQHIKGQCIANTDRSYGFGRSFCKGESIVSSRRGMVRLVP
jgi:hypothetical protein